MKQAPVAQLIEHRVIMWEVVSSTPAGPILSKLLDFQVFSGKDYKPEIAFHNPCCK